MWETVFDLSMLDLEESKHLLIVHCPTQSLAEEFLRILGEHGIKWYGDETSAPANRTNWDTYGRDTCYWVEGTDITFGPISETESDYFDHIRCIFDGVADAPDFAVTTDDELQSLYSITSC